MKTSSATAPAAKRRRPWAALTASALGLVAAAAAALVLGSVLPGAEAAGGAPRPAAAGSTGGALPGLGFVAPGAATVGRRPGWRPLGRERRRASRGEAGLTRAAMEQRGGVSEAGGKPRLFEAAPQHRGDTRVESLLDLAGQCKDDFVAAVQGLEDQAQLEVAEALIFNIRKNTNGGMLPSADGSLPKLQPEQRALLAEYVPAVLDIIDRLERQGHHHHDARVALYATEALSYELSVKSLIHAAPHLARIFKNIDMMVEKHPDLKGGAPFIIQGMMYLNAPVPVRSVRKAKECFQAAYRIDTTSPRNNYFCGVAAFLEKDYAQAHGHFAAALSLASSDADASSQGGAPSPAAEVVDEYLRAQCREGLALASDRMK